MSILRARRAREFAQLQAAGWSVTTVTARERLQIVRQDRDAARQRRRPATARLAGWSR